VEADGPASLLLGLELFVHSLLSGYDGPQGVGHLLELLLVRVVEFVHPLGKRPVKDMVAACISGSSVVKYGYDVVSQRYLFISEGCWGSGASLVIGDGLLWGCSVFLIFLSGRDVGQGFPQGGGTTAEVVVFHVDQELGVGADPLSPMPFRVCFDGVEVSFTCYFE